MLERNRLVSIYSILSNYINLLICYLLLHKAYIGSFHLIICTFSCRSLTVVGTTGYRLFALSAVDRVDELFCSHNEDTKIAERLFSSSLVAVVTTAEPTKLKVYVYKNYF